ncbi:MAG: GspD family T2SS secretin variant XcpQ [Gammaproteobacteria bacterium]
MTDRNATSRVTVNGCLRALLLLLLWFSSTGSLAASVTLNLKDADIRALIGTVSEVTGKNFIIDPRVKGRVTVISSKPMDEEAVYQAFLSVLQVHGYSAVPSGRVIKIVPDVSARQTGVPVQDNGVSAAGDELVTRIVQVENIGAAKLVPILRPLVAQQSHIAAYANANVLIITDRASNIERLVHVIRRIDRAGDEEIEVVGLEHASATEVVQTLTTLLRSGAKGDKAQDLPTLVADERTNSVLISADQQLRRRLRKLIGELDRPLAAGGNTQVIYLRYAKAKELEPVLNGVAAGIQAEKQGKGAQPQGSGDIKIQAHESTNSLVINAPPDVLRSLKDVIRRLDIRRAQVVVEAVIAEISTDKSEQLGVQWVVDGSGTGSAIGIINFEAAGISIASALADPPSIAGATGANVAVGRTKGSNDVAALISALSSDATTNILSTPSLVTLDNEEAEIVVAQNVPFVTGQYTSTGSGNTSVNPFQTIQREDVGLILRVKPQINEGNAVKLEVEQEVSSISLSAQQATDVITNKRSIKTSVLVDDGQVLVLGGLVDDTVTEVEQKVPGLGDIPGLGWLFKSRRATKIKRNLVVFLKPTILRTSQDSFQVTGGKYRDTRAVQLDLRRNATFSLPPEDSPLMPEFEQMMVALPPPFEDDYPASAGPSSLPDFKPDAGNP